MHEQADDSGTVRVLVVEDSLLVAMEIEEDLTARGFAVELASSVSGAEQRIGDTAFAAALLDCHLPDGHTLHIAQQLAARGCMVALVTGADRDGLPRGFEHFPRFAKPVPTRHLAEWVVSALDGMKAPDRES